MAVTPASELVPIPSTDADVAASASCIGGGAPHGRRVRAEIEYGAAVGRADADAERLVDRADGHLSVWLAVSPEVRVAARLAARSPHDRQTDLTTEGEDR